MRYDLFVSCASRNIPLAKPFLEELLQQIEQRSDLTWYFYDEPRRIGDEWATEAAAALRSASVFLPVYSPHYFKSDICRREYVAFLRRLDQAGVGRRRVVSIWWLPTPRELIPADVEDVVDTRLLLPGYAEWDFEGLFASRSLPTIPYARILRSLATLVVDRTCEEPDLPPGPEVDLRAGPTNFPAERAPRLATAKQRIGAVNRRSGAPERRNSLPPGPTWFAGRDAELTQIAGDRATADRALGTARVVAIHGMPGVGKTALALRAAHSIADRFTRCLYVDLQAHSDGRQPLTVVDAVGELLPPTDVSAEDLAAEQQCVARWRDHTAREHTAGGRLLLVLDNAASSRQIEPLIPAASGCVVLVTSRRRLSALDALPMPLAPLDRVESRRLFGLVSPRDDFAAEELDSLLHMAGDLPLAITTLARLFGLHPGWTMSNLIEQAHEGGLDISVEEKTIRAAFDLSFDNLQQKDQRVFLMLGVHPGRVVDREEIAAMTGSSVDGAGAQLERLCDASLLVEVGCHRYTLHDLVRRYVERKAAEMPTADRRQALTALVHHYATRSQQFAEEAGWSLLRYDTPGPRRPPAPLPEGRSQALTWFTSKRANLLDILGELDDGAVGECPHDAIRPAFVSLVAAMAGYLRNNGPWEVAERLHARAAELAPDPVAQAVAYNNLGITHRLLGQVNPSGDRFERAESALAEAERIFSGQIIDPRRKRMGRANALNERGVIANERGLLALRTGDPAAASQYHREALRLLRHARELYDMPDDPDLIGRANAAKNLGVSYGGLNLTEEADRWLDCSCQEYAAIHDALGEIEVLNWRGRTSVHNGRRQDAAKYFAAALEKMGRSGIVSAAEEARAFDGLRQCHALEAPDAQAPGSAAADESEHE